MALTAKQVIKKVAALEAKKNKAINDLQNFQENICPHHHLTYEPKGNTGNWDRSDDCYWYEWKCYDCGRYWHTNQTMEATNKYPHAKEISKYSHRLTREQYELAYLAKMRGESIV